ncbi:hypothetical protein VE03_05186 [Pseudogymnoascus sp. 23342-1-I1]|nr:hypothetical protein VE03_05186 [Pseudogymnoascus sp. 23342-1-I1]
MSTTINLDHGKPITYESALNKDANIINQAAYLEAATELYQSLWDQRQTTEALAQWIRGGFNVCIPIEVQSTRGDKKLIFRCPMPHKLAEAKYPGTVDEKLSSKVGTFLSNPNAAYDKDDCRSQMAAKGLLRMLSHHYVDRKRRNGPFYLQFTNLHASNIFVDEQWNITCLIDLEWVCALPAEMLAVPYWLTGHGIDEIVDDNLHEFDMIRQEFMKIFEAEETNIAPRDTPMLATIMQEGWESDGVWLWHCLTSINAMISLVEDHLSPRFSRLSSKTEEIISQYWCPDSAEVVERKVADYNGYKKDLEALFSTD